MPSTGIAGFTLGGGLGHLMRSCGLACDNLVSAEVVTADGAKLRADHDHHPDLFWALRRGGGNFGVVTEFEFALHQVGPVMLGGRLAHRLADARSALRFYRDFCADAPDSVMVYAGLASGPDGKPWLGWRAVVNGPVAEAEKLLAPLRAHGTPVLDDIRPQSYVDIQRMIEPNFPPGRLNHWKANFVNLLGDELIDVLLDAIHRVPSPYTLIAIEPMGGAVARVPVTATAFQHRTPAFSLLILSGWDDPADTDVNVAWTRELWTRTAPLSSSAVYVNYLGVEDDQRVRDAFGSSDDRLAQVKHRPALLPTGRPGQPTRWLLDVGCVGDRRPWRCGRSCERIDDRDALEHLTCIEVLGVQPRATGPLRRGDDRRIPQ